MIFSASSDSDSLSWTWASGFADAIFCGICRNWFWFLWLEMAMR